MSDEVLRAFLLWLPAGTLVPFLLCWRTGSSARLAVIEATIFALGGLLIYPTLLGLISARFFDRPNPEVLFVFGFLLATLTLLGFRRRMRQLQRGRYS
ncbi:hypothetical protein NET02_03075 [Thermomicrobiaceae bacterium CFH 74404]|uniref:Uncharacterized protein n=1 Tax=Thermalbibacter longus TaxID=2951981 RepID=A0AA41WAZ3_9BACT|nr:hypothetical protein [Thermalbibacter longus]MCM8748117.1 hypothetical protein [Thermalbibacter longus]